jgi:hypothetical protein
MASSDLFARRRLRNVGWWTAGALVVALAASLVQYHRATRASVPDVAAQSAISTVIEPSRALGMTVDGLGFPQRVDGFRALGGSTFKVGGRHVAAVVFARGEQRLTYAIVAGAKHVNFYDHDGEYAPSERYVGKRALEWYGDEMVAVKRNSRTVVITGTPASNALRRAMQALALQFRG